MDVRRAWGEDRVYVHDAQGELKRLPAAWTSAGAADPFLAVSAGRSLFRAADLLRLVVLVQALDGSRRPAEVSSE